jgi:cytochrome c biogenesis protein CcmG/thiol:disulfide interchange protein DsbE
MDAATAFPGAAAALVYSVGRAAPPDAIIEEGVQVKLHFLAVTAMLLALGPSCRSAKKVEAAKGGKELKSAPNFTLQDADGKTVQLSDFKGKVVLLDFWATWCGPCKIEIPWFIEFQRKYKDRGFTVLGVSMDDGWPIVKEFAQEFKMNYPVVLGNDELGQAYGGVEVLPTTFIIDKQGRIINVHMGLVSKDEMEKQIEDLL